MIKSDTLFIPPANHLSLSSPTVHGGEVDSSSGVALHVFVFGPDSVSTCHAFHPTMSSLNSPREHNTSLNSHRALARRFLQSHPSQSSRRSSICRARTHLELCLYLSLGKYSVRLSFSSLSTPPQLIQNSTHGYNCKYQLDKGVT